MHFYKFQKSGCLGNLQLICNFIKYYWNYYGTFLNSEHIFVLIKENDCNFSNFFFSNSSDFVLTLCTSYIRVRLKADFNIRSVPNIRVACTPLSEENVYFIFVLVYAESLKLRNICFTFRHIKRMLSKCQRDHKLWAHKKRPPKRYYYIYFIVLNRRTLFPTVFR